MLKPSPEVPGTALSASLSGLARLLVRNRVLDEAVALKAVEQSERQRQPLAAWLVEQKLATALDIALTAHRELGLPLLDLSAVDVAQLPIAAISEKLLRKHQVLPLWRRGSRLYVGVADPTDQQALDEIKFQSGLAIEPIVTLQSQIGTVLEQALDKPTDFGSLLDESLDNIAVEGGDDVADDSGVPEAEDAPVVRFVNRLLLDAINRGASDIHVEPYEHFFRVRFRQDGILHEVAKPPLNLAVRVTARLKVMAHLDIAERRVPQDGRMKMKLTARRSIDFRVNTLPTLYGEKVVLRILDAGAAKIGIDALGFEADQREAFLRAIHKPQGMVLVTGPTGSGKTVTLYTALNILNTHEVNISTAEDPVEIQLPGANQVNMNVKTGLTFANALRAFLRQDPDIIMVGEIRDLETAEIAIKASQTGHMVLSTLHTNDAPQTLSRLMNMGVEPYNIAASVTLIVAQRLARRLCPHCKAEEHNIPAPELLKLGFHPDELERLTIYKPVGCEQCTGGYKGRIGIYEVMPISEEMGRLIMSGGNSIALADQARREGVRDLRASGLNKIRMGLTSLDEINRVTKD
ncbi:type IV pilus assembly protein PilB [Plasticicumulans lactativorans]|uniref:Type IV pilus assembly protein PilB n=1 Tax=Plasticicumulans lactativorans TaxID=1133106 RepID=A0A4V2SCQ6_9GAMM|nr:type IV-A pilus assembly ATPase PilB [Plasticicumulans lactativorans]TCO80190.1 type IV pilus assembly protein PilB [Plasticicumulans lactativorans]